MKKVLLLTILGMIFCVNCFAQNVTANQNQQIINVNVPAIEKTVYVDRYRTVYVEKPRKARKLSEPVQLLGYLWVYPEDIGNFKNVPVEVLLNINNTKPYGRDNWRMPTPDELAILESNADQIGLGDGIYLATDHRNGILRLVATDIDYSRVVRIGTTYWEKCNYGAIEETSAGRPLSYQEAVQKAPKGYRLPTEEEALNLIYSGKVAAYATGMQECSWASILFPTTDVWSYGRGWKHVGYYWIQGGMIISLCIIEDNGKFYQEKYEIINSSEIIASNSSNNKMRVKYVLEK